MDNRLAPSLPDLKLQCCPFYFNLEIVAYGTQMAVVYSIAVRIRNK